MVATTTFAENRVLPQNISWQTFKTMLAENVSPSEISEDFPDLEPEDIQACLLFAACRTDFPRLTA
ncbi:DUF433 domain-containing protein [Nostoc sp. JL33]|uniref:DUF433 domain-containing protein n=1 Tax=Nostoc sp. JL33 TaxID=2815396 RepID=UPI0025CBEB40|nr:DUF433 domain-containing protein [Nostoc sp. JL33]